ncbi:MAG: hypothetical protein RL557_91 [archaeon]
MVVICLYSANQKIYKLENLFLLMDYSEKVSSSIYDGPYADDIAERYGIGGSPPGGNEEADLRALAGNPPRKDITNKLSETSEG